VSTQIILKFLLLNKEERKKEGKNKAFATAYFCIELFSARLLGNSVSPADYKRTH